MASLAVPPTFAPLLKDALPLGVSCGHSVGHDYGTSWFWETYEHALHGLTVIVRLGGTGVRLSEDSIDVLRKLRTRTAKADSALCDYHVSAALDVYFAFALSVLLHIAQQPLLEDNEGPHGLVLCATKEECDELSYVLNLLGTPLHLVVHNLFDLYPSMPASRRADVVVGTVPLWESVVQPSPRIAGDGTSGADSHDLDSILRCVSDQSMLAHSSTRWRPYSVRHISQCVIVDIELQVNMGFAPWLERRLTLSVASSSTARARPQKDKSTLALPPQCQLYVLLGEDRAVVACEEMTSLMSCISARSRRCGALSLSLHNLPASAAENDARGRGTLPDAAPHSAASRKRFASDEERPAAQFARLECGWLLHNALSFARLLDDGSALQELCRGVLDEVNSFWRAFEDSAADLIVGSGDEERGRHAPSAVAAPTRCGVVTADLAYVCREAVKEGCVQVQETCLLLRPRQSSEAAVGTRQMHRYALLFKHLEDVFSGRMFDGSIIYCSALDALVQSVEYRIIRDVGNDSHLPAPQLVLPELYNKMQPDSSGDAGTRRMTEQEGSTVDHMLSSMNSPAVLLLCAPYAQSTHRSNAVSDLRTRRDLMVDAMKQSAQSRKCGTLSDLQRVGDMLQGETSVCAAVPDITPCDDFTVLVLRHVTHTARGLWGTKSRQTEDSVTPNSEATSAIGRAIIEECCQYGRVVSYYTHEQSCTENSTAEQNTPANLTTSHSNSPERQEEAESVNSMTSAEETDNARVYTTASLFIEYERRDAAVEATRQLAYRFATATTITCDEAQNTQAKQCRPPKVQLFRNATYYDGVLESLQNQLAKATCETDGNNNDCFNLALLDE